MAISGLITTSSSSVIITLANTGPKEEPILTPSFCWYSLLLKENAVLVQVSNISFFKVRFLRLVETNLSVYILFKIKSTVRLIGTFANNDSTPNDIY